MIELADGYRCYPCARGMHEGCVNQYTDELCRCDHTDKPPTPVSEIGDALNLSGNEPDTVTVVKQTRRYKSDDAVTDPNSTGRKRAAQLYPLKDENGKPFPCDLSMKDNALPNYYEVQIRGCGLRPGSLPGNAQARHHWSYDTLNNARDNIGLLCTSCHALIHAKNDPYKDKIYERLYGFRPATDDLKWANKALISGHVGGGKIKDKDETLG